MCTEFFLVLIYFFILLCVNFLLFNLLKNYIKKITYFLKFQMAFSFSKNKNVEVLAFFYLLRKKQGNKQKFLSFFEKNILIKEDILILGNFYKLISENMKNSLENNYYFELLEKQYLSKSF